jgi:ABC-type multidrug transport system permease subunit
MNSITSHPIFVIMVTRLKEFIRRPEAVFWVYFFPIIMVVVMGIAFRNKPVDSFEVDVIEGPQASQIFKELSEFPQFKPKIVSSTESRKRLRVGKILLAVSGQDGSDDLVYEFDPQRPGSFAIKNQVDTQLQKLRGRQDVFSSTDVVFSEPGGRYVDFIVPGLLGMSLMGGGMWGVGFAIVDMRIRKLLKRFMATPMKRTHFLASMLLSRMIFMIPQIVVLLLFSYLAFGVKVYGSLPLLILIIFLGAIQFAAIGLVVGSRAQTLETASGLMNAVMLPMWLFCGIFFSYERFPEMLQPLIKLLPLTPLIDSLRAVISDGKGITAIVPELIVISLWSVIPFVIALLIFRWRD